MKAQHRAAIMLVIAALAVGPASAGTGAAHAPGPAARYAASGAMAAWDSGVVSAATPGPQTRWFGSITVVVTLPRPYQVPVPAGATGPGARVTQLSCRATITLNGATESEETTMEGTVVWPDHPQKGETETTKVMSAGQAPQAGPVQPSGTVQITPHPAFGTADYEIAGFWLPLITATVATRIEGRPADGNPPTLRPRCAHRRSRAPARALSFRSSSASQQATPTCSPMPLRPAHCPRRRPSRVT